jgi:hypothetical protein
MLTWRWQGQGFRCDQRLPWQSWCWVRWRCTRAKYVKGVVVALFDNDEFIWWVYMPL